MPARPIAISIVGWALVALGFYWFCESLGAVIVLCSPEVDGIIQKASPHAQQLVEVVLVLALIYSICGALFDIFIGMFVLAGKNWARLLYVVVEVLNLLVDYRFYPTELILNTATAIAVMVMLFLPGSNRYFALSH